MIVFKFVAFTRAIGNLRLILLQLQSIAMQLPFLSPLSGQPTVHGLHYGHQATAEHQKPYRRLA
jgi:hypothetical protein